MLDLLPVVIGDRLVLWLVPIGGKYDSEPVPTNGELVVLHGILVDVEHIPLLVPAGNKPFLIRGLLLARIDNKPVLWPELISDGLLSSTWFEW